MSAARFTAAGRRCPESRQLTRKNPMTPRLSSGLRMGAACLIAAAWQLGASSAALAQQPLPLAVPPPAEAPAPTSMSTPPMTGPLVANPNPMKFDIPPFNTIYVTGAFSGLGMFQSSPLLGDHNSNGDLSNGLVAVQTTEGLFQFFTLVGAYSFPALGAPYAHVDRATGDTFGPVPETYLKIVPNDAFSLQVGKLPTLIGAEYAFTFQNMNIERGLLWGQENAINRGVQANYTMGPLAFSGSLNDGFYSDSYNWLTGSAAYTIDKANTLTFAAGGNFGHTSKNVVSTTLPPTFKSPFFYNNSDIFNIIYTYSAAPWTITPYFQYNHVPSGLGFISDNATVGGAILASYAVNDNVSVAGRAEYIGSTGNANSPNLLFGPSSSAWSLTFTPTYQEGIYFMRQELSYVHANSITNGFAFGKAGNQRGQGRVMIEGGVIF